MSSKNNVGEFVLDSRKICWDFLDSIRMLTIATVVENSISVSKFFHIIMANSSEIWMWHIWNNPFFYFKQEQ